MKRRLLSFLDPAPCAQPLAPARALLTPTWIGALLVLIANDHILKGSHLLPGVVTGKLSDFAGMIVAPVLLAALLRVRSREALFACFVAVGAVFAGIQVSPAFAASWSALMGGIGFPWLITCDPTDLIALPTLALAWHLLVPEMNGEVSYARPMRRSATALASLVGLWASVATSQTVDGSGFAEEGEDGEVRFGNLAILNAGDERLTLRLRLLRPELALDCDQVANDPARMLQPEAFGAEVEQELNALELVAISFGSPAACTAVWVEGVSVEPVILFIDTPQDFPSQEWFRGSIPEDAGPGGMSVTADAAGGSWSGGESLRYTPEALPDPEAWGCKLDPAEQRIDWETPSHATNEVLGFEPDASGEAGCWSVQLQPLDAQGPVGEPVAWSLCVPGTALNLDLGERIELDVQLGGGGSEVLRVTLLDDSLSPALDNSNRMIRRVHYMRGGSHHSYISPAIAGEELAAIPVVSCPWQVIPGCATVERPVELALAASAELLEPGVPVAIEDGSFTHTVVLTHARERAVVDPSCVDSGANELSYDIDIALIDEPS